MEDRYEIRGKIGQGGLGAVYRAYDRKMSREVAIKRISSAANDGIAEESTRQLLKEASALASLQHPHIVTVHDFGSDEDGPYVVMELISGKTLDEIIQSAPLTWQDFRELALQTQEALIAAQDLDLIHSDLKPSNLMLTWLPSGKFQVKVVDFGLAMLTQEQCRKEIEAMDSVFGSIFFMPPEQFERQPLNSRSDMYSIGCVYYQALSCRYPFNGRTANEVMASHLKHDVVPLHELRDDIPQWISDWVMWHIKRQPADRPESAREALSTFLQNDRMTNPAMCPGKPVIEEPKRPKLVIPTAGSSSEVAPTPVSATAQTPAPAASVAPIPIPVVGNSQIPAVPANPPAVSPVSTSSVAQAQSITAPPAAVTPKMAIPASVPPLKPVAPPVAAAPPAFPSPTPPANPIPPAADPTSPATSPSAPPVSATAPQAAALPSTNEESSTATSGKQRSFERPKLVLPKRSAEDLQKSSPHSISGITSAQSTVPSPATPITTVQHLPTAPATPITTVQHLPSAPATPITAIQQLTPAPATPITTIQSLTPAPASPHTSAQSLAQAQPASPGNKPSAPVVVSPRDVPSVKSAPVATLQPAAQPAFSPQPLQPPAGSKPSLHTAELVSDSQPPPAAAQRSQAPPTAILKRTGSHSLISSTPQTHTSVTVLPSAPQAKRGISSALKAMIAITLVILIAIFSWVLVERMKQNRQVEILDKLVSDAARATATELPITKSDLDLLLGKAVDVGFNKHRGSIYKALLIAKATDGTEIDKTITTFVTSREMLPDVKETLIKDVLRMRKNPVIVPTLVSFAGSTTDTRSAIAALQSVRFMVDEQQFESFIKIIQGTSNSEVRRNAEETAMEIIRKSSIKGQLAEALSLHYITALNNEIRYSLLRLMGACGGSKALSTLQNIMASGDSEQIVAAISALGSWGDDDGFPVLVEFVKNSQDLAMRSRAFDAAHRYLGTVKDPAQQAEQWTLLSTQAKTSDEQIKIINGIVNLDGDWSYNLVQTYLKSSDDKVVGKAEKAVELMNERRKLKQ